jgi:hypothetical protein
MLARRDVMQVLLLEFMGGGGKKSRFRNGENILKIKIVKKVYSLSWIFQANQ